MESGNPSDDELWEACRKLPSDWEPHGQRRWLGRRESRPDCDTCRWFVELFRTSPDWGACANPQSERAGLLTFREQGCWQHEPEKERRYQATRSARCDFMRRYEMFLGEQAAEFIKQEVRKANDLMPDEEPSPTSEQIRQTPLSVVVRRLLRHADEDFRRSAFDGMAARARKDTRRYWEFARCFWSRTLGVDISEIDLPVNTWELEDRFWKRVDAAISEALRGRESRPTQRKRRRAGQPAGAPTMTEDELIERALREAGIFPPSVMDSHYGDKAEMTKAELIVRCLEDMGMLSLSEHDAQCGNNIRYIHIVTAELQRRLPDGEITTCGAFRGLDVGCCDICHTDPLHGMKLVELPGCTWAWLCCAVDSASSPEPYLVFHERERNPPAGKMRTCKFRNGGRRED